MCIKTIDGVGVVINGSVVACKKCSRGKVNNRSPDAVDEVVGVGDDAGNLGGCEGWHHEDANWVAVDGERCKVGLEKRCRDGLGRVCDGARGRIPDADGLNRVVEADNDRFFGVPGDFFGE